MAATEPMLARRSYAGLAAYYFFTFSAVGFLTPFLPLYWRNQGFSYLEIGALAAIASAAGALTLIPIGAWSDRRQTRRPFILAGSALVAACYAVYPTLHRFGEFAVFQILVGIGSTISMSTTSALGADVFRRGLAGRSFASVRSWGTIGFILIMGAIYVRPELVRGHVFYYLAGGLYLLAALSTLLVARVRDEAAPARLSTRGMRALFARREVAAFVLSYLLFYLALMSSSANLSLYLKAFRPVPADWVVPAAFALSAGIELPFLMVMGWAADRFGRMAPLRVAFVILPLRLLGYALAASPMTALALQCTHGLTFSVICVVPFAFMTDITPDEYRATGQAVLNAAGAVSMAAGPLLAGRIADVVGIQNLFTYLAGIAAIGAVLLFALVREPQRQTREEGRGKREEATA